MVKSRCLHASLIPRQLLGLGGEAGGRKESIFTNRANSKQTPCSKSSCSSAVPLVGLYSHMPHTLWASCLILPVISRTFKGNLNSRPFLPDMRTAEPNPQVRCHFTRQKHSRSTKNAGPAGCGPESRQQVCREKSAKRVHSEKQGWAMTGRCPSSWLFYCLGLLPSEMWLHARLS